MTVNRGLGPRNVGPVGVTPREHRLSLAGDLAENSPGVPRVGLLTPATVNVVTGNSGMSYSVAACQPVLNRGLGDGVYLPTFTGTTAIGTDPSPGTGFRYDLIWVFQADPDKTDLDGGALDNKARLGVTKGEASATPARPESAVPAGALILAEALVPAGATRTDGGAGSPTVTITQRWRHTVSRGAPIPVRDVAERNEITERPGLQVVRLDQGGTIEAYENGAWGVRQVNVPLTDAAGTATGWGNLAGSLPLRVETEGKMATLQGFVVRSTGTSLVIGVVPSGLRPRTDITWTVTAQNAGTTEGPAFRYYLSASTGVLSVNRLEGANSQPFWNNGTTHLAVNSGLYFLP